jgi:hypothetical protein
VGNRSSLFEEDEGSRSSLSLVETRPWRSRDNFSSRWLCSFKTYSSFDFDDHYDSADGEWALKMEDTVGGSGIRRAAVMIEL